MAAAHHAHLGPAAFTAAVAKSVAYFTAYLGLHVLVNQLLGVAEDRLDKPWRPLASGRVSIAQALAGRDVMLVAFPLLGWLWGVPLWALLWQVLVLMHAQTRLPERSGVAKNLYCAIGAIAQLAAAWQIAAPLRPAAWAYILLVAALVAVTAHAQDIRDVNGDRQARRRTLPIVLGDRLTRFSLCATFGLIIVIQYLLIHPHTLILWAAWLLPSALITNSGILFLLRRGPAADHRAYRRYEQWYAAICAAAIVAL